MNGISGHYPDGYVLRVEGIQLGILGLKKLAQRDAETQRTVGAWSCMRFLWAHKGTPLLTIRGGLAGRRGGWLRRGW